jgi:FlaA1/EpsC-like NDP-sugar epimerase
VFHAAAHKHVPLMEANRMAAFVNNVLGTRTVAEAAAAAGAQKFVMISTDKAVNPTSIMGASKRIAELVVQCLNGYGGRTTEYCSVRFGNVMGSSGSVIPLFTKQIKAGGPITVTHPEVVRYFMTIPEAAQLVLQAAAMGKGGELFVLDMGEPVKIAELARDLIRLSGLEPDVDVEIKYVGLRPGEKLYEELITAGEGIVPTPHEKIMVLRALTCTSPGETLAKARRVEDLAAACAPEKELLAAVRDLVPEYVEPRIGSDAAASGSRALAAASRRPSLSRLVRRGLWPRACCTAPGRFQRTNRNYHGPADRQCRRVELAGCSCCATGPPRPWCAKRWRSAPTRGCRAAGSARPGSPGTVG